MFIENKKCLILIFHSRLGPVHQRGVSQGRPGGFHRILRPQICVVMGEHGTRARREALVRRGVQFP